MLIYAMDTSGPTAGVALLKDHVLCYEAVVRNKMTHSESIMPMTEEAFLRTGLTISDVDLFSVVVGPGSFTGVRIGVTAVKALAHAEKKLIVPVDALEAFAKSVQMFDGILCPIQDARAGQVYGAAFEGLTRNRLMKDIPLKIEDYLSEIRRIAQGRRMIFVGDGVKVHEQIIKEMLHDQAVFASDDCQHLRPACVTALAFEKQSEAIDYMALKPLYLRAPNAERQKNLVENPYG